jgi:hypothetical protein
MRKQTDERVLLLFITVVLLVLIVVLALYFPFGPDWRMTYHRAANELLAGRNPHDLPHPRFLNPVWILLPILPLEPLPMRVGGAIFLMMSLGGFALAAYRLGAKPVAMGAFVASPPVLHCLLNGNIDWIPLVGVTLPPQIGLFFISAKPQIGITVALFWLVESWRKGRAKEVARVFAPVIVALLITFVLFGFWVQKWTEQPEQWWNASLFPWSVPFGLYCMARAIRQREIKYALPAGPSLSPYVIFHSWSAAVIAVVSRDRWTLAVSAALWVLIVLRAAFPSLW